MFCVVDLETTGLDEQIHEPIEISLVVLDKDLCVKNEFHSYIKPSHVGVIDDAALAVNKLKIKDMLNYPERTEVRSYLSTWWRQEMLSECMIPICHKWAFDSAFLKQFIPDLFDKIFTHEFADTKGFLGVLKSVGLFKGSTSLSDLVDRYGINVRSHEAMEDCYAVLELLKIIKRGDL